MKVTFLLLLALAGFEAVPTWAFEPPPTMTLEERAKSSSAIFVGKIERLYFVDGNGRAISPARAAKDSTRLRNNPVIGVQIRVIETMYSKVGRMSQVTRYRFQEFGLFYAQPKDRVQLLSTHLKQLNSEIGKTCIFIAEKIAWPGQRPFFASTYDTFKRENLSQKEYIQFLIDKLYPDPKRRPKRPSAVLLNRSNDHTPSRVSYWAG